MVQSKLTRLQHAAHKKRHKTDKNWVRNISSRLLDQNETHVLSYGLKHSVTPKHVPIDDIVSSVESVLARQRELPESTKDDIRSRIASTLQSASLTDCNLTKDKLHALKRLKNDKDIVILSADKGRVTVVMDKKDYTDKMDSLVNDKQTYESLKRDPTPALQRRLNGKLLDLKKTETIDIQLYYWLRCRVPQSAKLYGLPKLNKPNIPMRHIVSFCGSPTYLLSKHLTNILKPLTDESQHKLQSTDNFTDAIKTVQIPDDHKLVSFDVKSLFTSIPLQLALDCTKTAINKSPYQPPLPTDDLMDLLQFSLTSTYFQYNDKHYKQPHGTAMGSPVSVVVAEIVIQNIEEQALATYSETLPLWLRYVDDTMTAVHKNKIDEFHEHLNKQNTSIQFTKEIKENGEIPFLNCLVTRENNTPRTTIYRKPTYTDRLLDQTSYNPTSHKATTVRTLTRRAQIVCDSHYSLTDETKHLNTVFIKNNYSTDFIKRNAYFRLNDSSNNSYTTTATIYTLHTRDLRNHSTHTTTLHRSSCTQTHVHFTTLTH